MAKESAERILAKHPEVEALFAVNDDMALGVTDTIAPRNKLENVLQNLQTPRHENDKSFLPPQQRNRFRWRLSSQFLYYRTDLGGQVNMQSVLPTYFWPCLAKWR